MAIQEFIQKILDIPEETQSIEFKRLSDQGVVKKVVASVVAMANTDGGILVLGVDDPEKTKLKGVERIFGVEEGFDHFDEIGRELSKIIPPLSHVWPPQLEEVIAIQKTIALIIIPKAQDCFRSINNHVYIRQRKSNKLLNPQEIIDLSYAKGFQRADQELVDVSLHLLETEVFRLWQQARGIKGATIADVLGKVGLARKDVQGIVKPTRAAVLLFAEYPTNLLDTKCTVRVFQYTGTIETIGEAPNLLGTPKTIEGPITQLIQESHEYILGLLRSGIRVPSGFVTQYTIPERVIKEAITNAIIHRDYHIKRDIEVRIFEDRVEIENPGLFPFNITPSNIGLVRSRGYRNDLIVKTLREFPSPPNLDQNEGVRAMQVGMDTHNLYPPIYYTYPNLQDAVRLVLLNETRATEWEKISTFLEVNKYIGNEDARKITGIIQRDKMTQLFKKWVSQGLLVQIVPASGYLKGTRYRLVTNADLNNDSIRN